MTCEYLDRDLDPYVDRELSGDADAAVRTHLNACAACRARVAERRGAQPSRRSLFPTTSARTGPRRDLRGRVAFAIDPLARRHGPRRQRCWSRWDAEPRCWVPSAEGAPSSKKSSTDTCGR